MRPYLLCIYVLSISISSFSQEIQLINSGEVITEAKSAYDTGNYEGAIKRLLTIHEADTNYVYMLSELASAYLGNKEFDKSLETVQKALAKPSIYRPVLLKIEAVTYSRKGEIEKSISLFQKALEEYPTETNLMFNLAIVYYNSKAYEKAIDYFYRILAISPFHQGSHLNLGRLAIGQGRKVHAMLSLGIYLGINSSDNKTLVLLDNFLDNEVSDEGSIQPIGTNSAEKLDRIIKARIAMEKDFDSAIPISAAVVKQYELLIGQLSSLDATGDDKWLRYYLPVYRAIKESNSTEAFIYHLLTSTNIEPAKKWRSKNEKSLKQFYSVVNSELKKPRSKVVVPQLGVTEPTLGWYADEGTLEALGNTTDEKRQGPWIFFFENQQKTAIGNYDKGVKKGTWKYYNDEGAITSIENYDSGEVTVYFPSGATKEKFILKDFKINGEVTLFYECGAVKEKLGFKEDKRSGKGELYYPSGHVKSKYNYVDGNLDGEYLSYYENGQPETKSSYLKDQLHGKYVSYYINGRPYADGEYTNGEISGPWKYYHENGRIQRTGSYAIDGKAQGEWVYYDEAGLLTEKRNFNKGGERHGENSFYYDGKLHYSITYKNGILIKLTYFDSTEKTLASYGSENGTFKARNLYSTGSLLSEGAYKKGQADGVWKYYNRYGKQTAEYTYLNGMAEGPGKTFYSSGEKKTVCSYKDDELHGYFVEYYKNGNVKQKGWYQNGLRQQQWLTYYADGLPETNYYYLNDQATGTGHHYSVEGTESTSITNKYLAILDIKQYGPKGSLESIRKDTDRGFSISEYYANKKVKSSYEVICGEYANEYRVLTPAGKTYIKYQFLTGEKHGPYEYHNSDGTLDIIGQYSSDKRSGTWKRYHDNGKLYSIGRYVNGDKDSIWTYYRPNEARSSAIHYKNDIRHGTSLYYSPDGKPLIEKLYHDDELIAYRPAGENAVKEWIPFSGTGKIVIRYADNKIALEEEFKDGMRHGQRKLYFTNGSLYEVISYEKDDRTGDYRVYHANGKIAEKGAYKENDAEGKIEYFDENGILSKVETYNKGVLHGKEIRYANGKVVRENTFWNGYIIQ